MATKIAARKKTGENERTNGDTRERLLRAAEELFIERGFDGVSVNDVAMRADTAKALVFYYFRSKQELFDTVLDGYYRDQAASLVDAIGGGGGERERVHAGIDAYCDFLERHPGFARLIQREICSETENTHKIIRHMEPLYRWGLTVFGDTLPATGPLAPRHFFISIFGMIINYYVSAPVLAPLIGEDPMHGPALSERRGHIHLLTDAILDRFLK